MNLKIKLAITVLTFADSMLIGGVAATYANTGYETPTSGLAQTTTINQNLTTVSAAPVVTDTTGAPTTAVPTKTTTKPNKNSIVKPADVVDSSTPTIDPTTPSTSDATPAMNRHVGNVVPGEACPDDEHNWSGMTGAGKVVYCVLVDGIWQWSK